MSSQARKEKKVTIKEIYILEHYYFYQGMLILNQWALFFLI